MDDNELKAQFEMTRALLSEIRDSLAFIAENFVLIQVVPTRKEEKIDETS